MLLPMILVAAVTAEAAVTTFITPIYPTPTETSIIPEAPYQTNSPADPEPLPSKRPNDTSTYTTTTTVMSIIPQATDQTDSHTDAEDERPSDFPYAPSAYMTWALDILDRIDDNMAEMDVGDLILATAKISQIWWYSPNRLVNSSFDSRIWCTMEDITKAMLEQFGDDPESIPDATGVPMIWGRLGSIVDRLEVPDDPEIDPIAWLVDLSSKLKAFVEMIPGPMVQACFIRPVIDWCIGFRAYLAKINTMDAQVTSVLKDLNQEVFRNITAALDYESGLYDDEWGCPDESFFDHAMHALPKLIIFLQTAELDETTLHDAGVMLMEYLRHFVTMDEICTGTDKLGPLILAALAVVEHRLFSGQHKEDEEYPWLDLWHPVKLRPDSRGETAMSA